MTKEQRDAAVSWVQDCAWRDVDPDDVPTLSDAVLLRGIERNYEGGWFGFLRDGLLR